MVVPAIVLFFGLMVIAIGVTVTLYETPVLSD